MHIPKALILFRLLLAPIILTLAYFVDDASKITVIILMYLGLVSKILGGIVAHKQGIPSAQLRRMDRLSYMVFWLSIGFTAWILYPQLIANNSVSIYIILEIEITCYIIIKVKFKKETYTHAFLSKL
ncbi:hypothetical protein F0365_12905 [Nonlabens sp. Ci31]|jgi:CDP-diacylglycerol--glycerol-3-phosphate 3-phosphatidyltransferase|uniref:CDP-alcohol phosphatidyltransferase family protein n=1 Tax=Nonlabens sp. Ci31 TaxID=2608253 RepID=UPI0014642955|nr:CDP-alcohol phosphatidyltransferase family protein [Nonlabens sp. Ci31]QJP35224.1 hypothetical protein F0365_12905 [Nonlabens sp. Ci31]